MDTDRYLDRIGVDPTTVGRDRGTLARLQRAHLSTVPFETLAITGDPHGDRDGEGVSLSVPDSYEKVVERGRGGFCYELNGPFGWLLDELGFDVGRRAARVVGEDGARPPANHLTSVVDLDRRYVVDVGMGSHVPRRPLPLDGTVHEDAAGVAWRAVESDRPDADYAVRLREPGADDWTTRYVFTDVERTVDYCRATCEFLATAPESPFTGAPTVSLATDRGYRKLRPETLIRVADGERTERSVAPDEYHDLLRREFGLAYPPDPEG